MDNTYRTEYTGMEIPEYTHQSYAGPSDYYRHRETYLRTDNVNPPMIHVTPDYGPNSLPIAGSKSAPRKFR